MEPGAAELYDQALLGILQHVGNVQDFLRVLFGFLYRKTDFYRLLRHPTDRMGFPPGAAQALVLQVTGRPGDQAGRGRAREAPPRRSLPRRPFLRRPLPRSPDPRDFAARPSLRARPPSPSGAGPGSPPGTALRVSRAAGRISSCSSGQRAWRLAARVTPAQLGVSSSAPGLPAGDGSADLRAPGHGWGRRGPGDPGLLRVWSPCLKCDFLGQKRASEPVCVSQAKRIVCPRSY